MFDHQGSVPVVGIVVLTGLSVVLAVMVVAAVDVRPPEPAPTVSMSVDADASGEIGFHHRGGESLDPAELTLRVRIDGEPLVYQPPVPFFSATGFESGPTGPFNSAATGEWHAGESASITVAASNEPQLEAGATVEIRLYSDDRRIVLATTTVD